MSFQASMKPINSISAVQGTFAHSSDPSGRLEILADAQLLDRADLASAVGLTASEDDVKLILAAYRRWGPELCRHLYGEYAFAILDRENGTVLLGRDHIGFRALFHSQAGDRLLIASDPASLVAASERAQLDEAYAALQVLGGRRFDPHRTFWKDIDRLPAGHCLAFRNGARSLTKWWRPFDEISETAASPDDLVEQGRELLRKAIADSIPARSNVGIHVTGGLDSSSILALGDPVVRATDGRTVGYAWQGPAATDEGPRIEAAARMVEMELRTPELSDDGYEQLWRRDWATRPSQWNLLHELAVQLDAEQRGVGTILSGWGGDEAISFNGRGIHADYLAQLKLTKLAALSPHSGIKGLAAAMRTAWTERSASMRGRHSAPRATLLSPDTFAELDMEPQPAIDMRNCRVTMRSLIETGATSARIEDWFLSGNEHGVRYRYPLLDRRVMEFAYSLPSNLFRTGTTRRWMFREMMKGILPETIRCETSKKESLRTNAQYARLRRFWLGIADEVEDRRSTLARAPFFDMDKLVSALRDPPELGDPRFGHLRRAMQFLDI